MKHLTFALTLLALSWTGTATIASAEPIVAKSAPLIVSDFEDSTQKITTYAGPKSSVKAQYESEIVHGGKLALKVTENTSDWSGALLMLGEPLGNWAGYSKLKVWIFGGKTGGSFNIDLEDKGGEQFRDTLTDNFAGWKEFVIPFRSFSKRADYQAPDAVQNGKIDWPLKTIQFFTASQFQGSLIFDDMSVEP